MSSVRLLASLLAVFATATILAVDEDFAFDVSDDLEVEFDPEVAKRTVAGVPKELTAIVGRIFHFTLPKETEQQNVKYEAKANDGKPLPHWLLFDKTGGVFWGLPLHEDIGTIHITVKTIEPRISSAVEFTLVVEPSGSKETVEKCPPNEDKTVLTLLIDRSIHVIKPRERIIAINNIAKFFGLPYSAFSLQPQDRPDDLSDSTIVLAGPGNLAARTSKTNSFIKLDVGCDGRLWLNSAPLVHQLKQQSRDGTIAEVVRLPIIGWRVRLESRQMFRSKRHVDEFGSGGSGAGDYDENYESDYENYEDEEYDDYSDPDAPLPTTTTTLKATKPTTTTVTTTTTRTTTTTTPPTTTITTTPSPTPPPPPMGPEVTSSIDGSSTHHHRHHHGQISPADPTKLHRGMETEVYRPTEEHRTTQETTAQARTTVQEAPVLTTPVTIPEAVTEKIEIPKPDDALNMNYDDEDEDYEDEDDIESETIIPDATGRSEPRFEIVTDTETTLSEIATTKPEVVEFIPETTEMVTKPTTTSTTPVMTTTTTTTTTPAPTTTETVTIPTTIREEPSTQPEIEPPSTTTSTTTTTTTTTTTPKPTETTTTTTEKVTTEQDLTTTVKQTTVRHLTSTQKPTTTFYTETIEYEVKNFPPTIQNRLKRIATTAGKAFSYIIPLNTFTDIEDGDSLHLEFLDNDGKPMNKTSWCQFNPRTREIYGLPLEEDVSRWEYVLKATDKEGASVSDHVEIIVHHHKSRRVVNHEFSLYMHVEKKWEFPHDIDWSLKTLRAIGQLYHMSNLTDITVRRINYTSEPVVFVWTNDSLPKSYCPTVEIEKLFEVLTANDEGDPSHALTRVLVPELRVKKVMYHGLGVCETKPQPPPLQPITPPINFSPILRNPVDHINSTVGELLVFKVPDDTFYDPEDVDSRNLKMTLLTVDRQQIPSDHWLQFDSKNKEFYGIPLPQDVGRSEYQLVCEDSGGLPASDSLVVVVHVPPRRHYNVEFSMTLDTPYESFINSASMQRKFIEKLKDLFNDQNTSYIHLSSISRGSTIVSWYNKSLSLHECPRQQIKQLESILVNNDRTIASRVQDVMDPEFKVSTIKLQLIGSCKGRPNIQSPTSKGVPVEEPPLSDHEDYLITFIVPAVIICAMLLLAGIAACVLYRRRRTGKMNVEEDGRSTFGNKGIPVIFQEELEEKPEPGTKAPIILKDEKPPLAPPEYSKSGSLKLADDSEPYQPPPPPFTRPQDNARQQRPKPTPTYRKPPPYVPP